MEKTFKILVALVLICSCSEDEEQTISTDWHTELIGVGYIGENPDSLNWPFSYYPCENNQPELLNHQYELQPVIIGDTIIFPNILLYNMFRDMEIDNRISKDSSKFLISTQKKLYKFSKIGGHNFIPKTFYYQKYPNDYPKSFMYQSVDGFDHWDNYQIEISGKDSIRVWLKGSPDNPYLFEQDSISDIDILFIGSYLNLICDNRYDTITFGGAIFCGTTMDEVLVFNDSIFDYNTYFRRVPDGGILLNYFRSKIDKDVHSLKEFDFDMKSKFEIRKFKELPVAVENWKILEPLPSLVQEEEYR
ncbi:MAG: hypothetical protein COA38_08370 [Fluviicola sp.]|nr:MAG: hypothetical protein COA38_08370 [Fluviicola sp.]